MPIKFIRKYKSKETKSFPKKQNKTLTIRIAR